MRSLSKRGVVGLCSLAAIGALVIACGSTGGSGFLDTLGDAGGGDGSNGDTDGNSVAPPVFSDGDGSTIDTGVSDTGAGGQTSFDANIDAGQCGADTTKAANLPLDLFIIQDVSGSMNDQVAAGVSKYSAVKTALTSFVNDPSSVGIGVGIQFFPLLAAGEPATCTTTSQCKGTADACDYAPKFCQNLSDGIFTCTKNSDCGLVVIGGTVVNLGNCVASGTCQDDPNYLCANVGASCGTDANGFALGNCQAWAAGSCIDGDSCVNADYQTPAVAIADLPGSAAAIITALNAHPPSGGTPTLPAVTGAIAQAQAFAKANPTHTVAVVLATDGLPDECDATAAAQTGTAAQNAKYVSDIQAAVAAGVSGTPAIKTFVIGVFDTSDATTSKPNLDAIAMSGGTTSATIVTQGVNTTTQFQAALNAIRQSALPCTYAVPTPPADGGTPDYSKVNVEFTSSTGVETLIGNRTNAAACDPTSGGWYFDQNPPATPTTITLCPATCNAVKNAAVGGHVDVILGCTPTIVDAGTQGGGGGIH